MVNDPVPQRDDRDDHLVRADPAAAPARGRRWLRRWWPALAAAYAWAASTGGAALFLRHQRAAAGLAFDFGSLLLWQALVYGAWLPVGLALLWVVRRFGLGQAAIKAAAALAVPAVLLHALIAALLGAFWSPRIAALGTGAAAIERMPVDLLVFMVLAAFVWATAFERRVADLAAALRAAREAAPTARPEDDILLVSLGNRRVPVPASAVEWFGAAGNYAVANWDGREGLIRTTLTELERQLDPARFARVHRSTLANLARVESASPLADGSWRLVMKSGAELVASRTYRDRILARLGRR